MSAKPKKNNRRKMQPQDDQAPINQPVAPITPPAAANEQVDTMQMPAVGQQVMARVNAENAGWCVCRIVKNPSDANIPLVEFPDGLVYRADKVQIGGIVAQAAPASNTPHYASQLSPEMEQFALALLEVYRDSQKLFGTPLANLLTMVIRQAHADHALATGVMDVVSGQPIFIPSELSFEQWLVAYIQAFERHNLSAE